ncbi:MAG: hypothetical protein AB1941_11175 [Gemmatimonadota bacterium]
MRTLCLITLAALVLTAAACNDDVSPTASVHPGAPSFDGSGMVGSGNRDGSTSTVTTVSDSTGALERGSGMVGSGN